MAAVIELEDVSLAIGDAAILAGVNLTVDRGEVVSIIGQSGCGKTTTLNIVAGLVTGWSGRAEANETPITGPGADRTVVFQEDAVFPWMTVRRNVGYALELRGIPQPELDQTVAQMIELVGLTGKERDFPRQLSGGQRKRIDLARALAAKPTVLLMDEPYAALDQMTKQRLQQEFLAAVGREQMTSMFVTHDLEEAIFVANRVVVMAAHPGRIVDVVEVPFDSSREDDLRTSTEFQTIRRRLEHAIADLGTEDAAA